MKAKKVVGEELDEVESDLKFPPFRGLHTLLLLSLSFISLSLTLFCRKRQNCSRPTNYTRRSQLRRAQRVKKLKFKVNKYKTQK